MKVNILTFDLEEWFHVFQDHNNNITKWHTLKKRLPGSIDIILNLLSEFNIKATFFCIGWVAQTYPEIVRNIADLNYEIGSHSYYHRLAHSQNYSEFNKDFVDSLRALEYLTGSKVKSYRAPGFSINDSNLWVFDILIENGIENDCSIFPLKRKFGGFKNFKINEPFILKYNDNNIKEFPMSSFNFLNTNIVFSGGGFFRLLPYWLIRSMMKNSKYVMTYFHPRDFDPHQPFKQLSFFRRIKSSIGCKYSFNKLSKMLEHFNFTDISGASELINWGKAKVIEI